jgi:hypothetical protein
MDPTYRLRTATRLHFLLLRRYGQDLDVSILLKATAAKHDGLWLCRATGDAELIRLARQLARANQAHAEQESRLREDLMMSARTAAAASENGHGAAGATAQSMPWGRNTTGFGVTSPQDLRAMPSTAGQPARWFNPMHWIKGNGRERGH